MSESKHGVSGFFFSSLFKSTVDIFSIITFRKHCYANAVFQILEILQTRIWQMIILQLSD